MTIQTKYQEEVKKKVKYFQPNLSNEELKELILSFGDVAKDLIINFVYMTRASMRIDQCQSWMGKRRGVCRKTINELLGKFAALKLIHKTRRFNDSCIIYLSRIFLDPEVMEWLGIVNKSISIRAPRRVTLTNIKEEININKLTLLNEKDYLVGSGQTHKSELVNKFIQKGNKMELNQLQLRIKTLLWDRVSLDLLDRDIIDLEKFPYAAIDKVSFSLRKRGDEIDNKMAYLLSGCRKFCQQHDFVENNGRYSPPTSKYTQKEGKAPGSGLVSQRPAPHVQRSSTGPCALYKPEPQEDLHSPIGLEEMLSKIDMLEKQKEVLKKSKLGEYLILLLDQSIEETAQRCPAYVAGLKKQGI